MRYRVCMVAELRVAQQELAERYDRSGYQLYRLLVNFGQRDRRDLQLAGDL